MYKINFSMDNYPCKRQAFFMVIHKKFGLYIQKYLLYLSDCIDSIYLSVYCNYLTCLLDQPICVLMRPQLFFYWMKDVGLKEPWFLKNLIYYYSKEREMQKVNDVRIFFFFVSIVQSTQKYDENQFFFFVFVNYLKIMR